MTSFVTDNYNSFLIRLSELSHIDTQILDNLYKTKFLYSIFKNIPFSITENKYIIFENLIELNENYSQQLAYIYSQYPLHNNKFNIIPFDENSRFFPCKMITKTGDFMFFNLHFQLSDSLFFIELYLNINIQDFTEYSTEMLLIDEKEKLQTYINNEINKNMTYDHSIGVFCFNNQNLHFICINNDLLTIDSFIDKNSIEKIDLYLNDLIFKYKTQVKNIKTKKIAFINSFFERALLEKQIKNF